MQINSNHYMFIEGNDALEKNLQDFRAIGVDPRNKIEGIDEKVKVRWNRAATFISSAFTGLTGGGAAGLAAWKFSAIVTPQVLAAAASLGLVINPALAPVVVGVGVGLGVAAITAVLISSVAKLSAYFRINRAEKHLDNIEKALAKHREHFNQKPVFNYKVNPIPEDGDQNTRANVLAPMVLHLDRMSKHLETLAQQSKDVSAVLDKEQAVIHFACHDMFKEYQTKFKELKLHLDAHMNDLADPMTRQGQDQYHLIKVLERDSIVLEAQYTQTRDLRLEFLNKQVEAQRQYVDTLKEKLS